MTLRNISSWAIRHPIPPLLLFVLLTAVGLLSFYQLKITQMPDISVPFVSVTVVQPGGAPTEIETQVTRIIEGAIAGIGNVKNIDSVVQEGSSTTMVEFYLGTPVDRAVNDVRDAVTKSRADLPDGILEPRVNRMDVDASAGAIAYVAAQSTSMTLEQLSWFVDNDVTKRLVSIPGVAQVTRSGGVAREIRIDLDPVRMQSYGITAAQVNTQLRQLNLDAPGGRTEIAGAEQAVRVLGGARTAPALAATRISIGNDRNVRLSDIATVTDGTTEQREVARLNGRQVTAFGIFKAKGASDVDVYNRMQQKLAELHQQFPDVAFTELFTSVDYTKGEYKSAMQALSEGALLAVLVVFLFLKDWRATVIAALAIPLSAIPTFWFMDLLGFTLNTVSLLALSLVAGILVDDAIVEIENIVRHMRMGKSPFQAALEAADEIGLAVVATTSAIMAVFLPVAFMPGIPGQYFKQFGLTVAVAVFVSLLVARLITPLVAAYFLRPHGIRAHADGAFMRRYLDVLSWTIHIDRERPSAGRSGRAGRTGHVGARLRAHWRPLVVVGLGVASFLLTIFLFAQMPTSFQPDADIGSSHITVELPPGATLADTTATVDHVLDILWRQPEVRQAFQSIGGADVRRADIFINLVGAADRDVTTKEFERRVAPELTAIADARINFSALAGGFGGRDVVVMLASDDPLALEQSAKRVEKEMQAMPTLRDARINGDLERPEILIRPKFALAAQMGVSVAALSQTIRIATIGDLEQNMAKFSLADRQVPIRVSLMERARSDPDILANLPVPTSSGGSVPLKTVADISFGAGPTTIRRHNQSRRITIEADLNGIEYGNAMKDIRALPAMRTLPTGVQEVKFGQAEVMDELVMGFAVAIVSGVLLVFAVLVLLYQRVLAPLVNMGSLLLAPLGGIIALILTGHAVSMPVYIGLLMLMGIVAKNSILLVDFAIEEMRHGVPRETAILDAGHKRAQPIVMTTVAMIAGMLPVGLGLHGDSSFRAPMAIVVIGGLLLSTVLTLVIVPAAFILADSAERHLGPRMRRLFTNGGETASTGGHGTTPEPHAAE